MSFSGISIRLTGLLTGELDCDEEKKEILAYAIEAALVSVAGTLLLVFLAWVFHVLLPAGIAAVFGVILRRVSGGAHFDSPYKCLPYGAVVYTFLGWLAKVLAIHNFGSCYLLLPLLMAAFLLTAFLAPVDSAAKPIHSLRLRRNLKIASLAWIALSMAMVLFTRNQLVSVSAALGIGYQSLTLLPVFNKRRWIE